MATDAHSNASSHRGGRAIVPGPRRVYLGAVLAAIVIAAIAVLAVKPGGSGAGGANAGLMHRPLTKKFGHVPSYITIPTVPAATVVNATARTPDLSAMEGDPVRASLTSGSAQLFVAGPAVPGWVSTQAAEGKLGTGQSVPSTFTVSFSDTHGTVPLSAAAFSLLTYQGTILHPTVRTSTGGPLPATLPAGKTINLRLTTSLPEGDGSIRWAPAGEKILVSYFWTLEFD